MMTTSRPLPAPIVVDQAKSANASSLPSPDQQRRSAVDNPTPHALPTFGSPCPCPNPVLLDSMPSSHDRLVIVMVGLPGRGKTFIARRIVNYLSFFHGITCKNVNVADRLRECDATAAENAETWDPENAEGRSVLHAARQQALADVATFIGSGEEFSKVCIVDGLNVTVERRSSILEALKDHGTNALFIETIITDQEQLEQNMEAILRHTPDFQAHSSEAAKADFLQRVAHCERVTQTMDHDGSEAHLSWIRITDFSRYEINNVHGYLKGRVAQLVMHLTNREHALFLTRHGQSDYNVLGKIGGDAPLTADGEVYARKLAEYAQKVICTNANGEQVPARLWTSCLQRTKLTAQFIPHPTLEVDLPPPLGKMRWEQMRVREWRHLDEIYAGVCDGMTYAEIEELMPEEFELRRTDKLAYRYPRGESYLDVCHRLEPIIMEMERCVEPLLIVAHQGILRLIYAYFKGIPRERAPHVSIPLNTVISLRTGTYACRELRELLHTKHNANSDGQAEPVPLKGLSPAPSRPQLSREGLGFARSPLSFQTFSIDQEPDSGRRAAVEPVVEPQKKAWEDDPPSI